MMGDESKFLSWKTRDMMGNGNTVGCRFGNTLDVRDGDEGRDGIELECSDIQTR